MFLRDIAGFDSDPNRRRVAQHLVAAMITIEQEPHDMVAMQSETDKRHEIPDDYIQDIDILLRAELGAFHDEVIAPMLKNLQISNSNMSALNLQPSQTRSSRLEQDHFEAFPNSNILPGDAIFREQEHKALGIIPNPMREFGHAGIYLGCPKGQGLDVNEPANHQIIHVIDTSPACKLQNLVEFCKPKNTKLDFWGFYQADLTPQERSNLISLARTFPGSVIYNFTSKYKTATGIYFRCDGFVEYLHEAILPTLNPLQYRQGLFEDDRWQTLNPAALRNCFIKRYDLPAGVAI